MKRIFNGLLILVLLIIIIGGIGYIGYNYLFMNRPGITNGAIYNEQSAQQPANSSSMAGIQHGNANTQQPNSNPVPGMQHGNMNGQESAGVTAAGSSQAAEIAALALKNRDVLNQALSSLNEAIEYMSLDPYGASQMVQGNNSMANMPGMSSMPGTQEAGKEEASSGTSTTSPNIQGKTTINIYPQVDGTQGTQSGNTMQSSMMADMGTTYDPNRMEQLHSGLYKLSLGMKLLNQLGSEFAYQAESAALNIQDPAKYYSLQYTAILQIKSKLSQALIYVNEASNLVNINPYISSKGMVYDQERMQQIHKSVFKLADGVAALNMLGDDLTKQAVAAANTAQGYLYAANSIQMNHSAPAANETGSVLSVLNIQFIINAILAIFVTAFILGILGFILSLLKSPAKSQQ